MTTETKIFDRLSVLADSTRSRLLLVLEEHELTVSELCSVLQLPQSTVSRHLKVLGDDGWVASRRDGTSRRYRMSPEDLEGAARNLWRLTGGEVASQPAAEQDGRRLESVLAERRSKSQEFFSSAVGEWDRLRQELFGRRADLLPLLALLDESWTVGDLGCGTGQTSESLAPFVAKVIAVDDSAAMLSSARDRLGGLANVEIRRGRLEGLPIEDASLDAATLLLVLHHLPEPRRALSEVARVLKPGGKLLIVDMTPHDREEYRREMGHVWLGFSRDELGGWLASAGFDGFASLPVPADPKAKGPALFAARARRSPARIQKSTPELRTPAETEELAGIGVR